MSKWCKNNTMMHLKLLKLLIMMLISAMIVRNGLDRGSDNCWHGSDGNFIEYKFTGSQ